MWASIQRGGEFFSQNGRVEYNDKGQYDCMMYYAPGGVPKEVRPSLEKYIRGYAGASGWTVKSLRFAKNYALVGVAPRAPSKAASSLSKNS